MTSANNVRSQLIDALQLDLIGPRTGHAPHARYAEEDLPIAPSKWYLTGFLVPYQAPAGQRADDDGNDTLDEINRKIEADDDNAPEGAAARKGFFPSSMGLSVLVSDETDRLQVKVAWADYLPISRSGQSTPPAAPDAELPPVERAGRGPWRRVPREAERFISLEDGTHPPVGLPGFEDLVVVVSVRSVGDHGLVPPGTRSVSVFFVNSRPPAPDEQRDAAYVFQPELSLLTSKPFVPRPDLHGQGSDDQDEKIADLQYRDVVEIAVGHNIAAMAVKDAAGPCREVRTAWMPTADVEKVVARELPEVELGMEALAAATSAQVVRDQVGPMLTAYAAWLTEQVKTRPSDPKRKEVADGLLANAQRVHGRIQCGLDALGDPKVFEAFRTANRAIATAIRQRLSHDKPAAPPASHKPPTWRPFQLAFLLMNLVGTAQPTHADRKVVDLLFFPTGGGKTEAYLGLAAFAMVLRRLRNPSVQSAGLSVLMRYTLRLLTLDQLGRAATLVCALELERQQDVPKLGAWPFEIGLWVGQAATPNHMGRKGDNDVHSARARTIAYLNDSGGRKPAPVPLENCPWCGWKFTKDSFKLLPNSDVPTDLRVMCVHRGCAFHSRRQPGGLPILAVDEPIYRRLPAFIIATVDKFANLPWVGETAGLFGRVDRHDTRGFYGPTHPAAGLPLKGPLPPPDLVIQDELHLISGPLGTMVGLYEAAIDALASTDVGGDAPRPKIVASTATVRRAERQIRALFGRTAVEVFPPPGPDRRDSFFAVTVGADARNPRTYLGIAAQGRNLKVVLLRTYLALMAAAQKAWQENGSSNLDNPADPYMTLVGYFNSLRELGGSRRIVEDEVKTRLVDYSSRRRRVGKTVSLFVDRPRLTEPCELTSRVSTNEVADTKRRLALPYVDEERVDVALATNMISVGLDIQRLGLMVVLGQPKMASEYIQATSRVGRDDARPGLVVTLLNVYRPRDRSHYERFCAWHESFYRSVEATSVTPFSPRAIDRGIAAVTVALARLGHPGMTAPRGALAVNKHRVELEYVADVLARRAEGHDAQLGHEETEALRKKVKDRVNALLDAWQSIATKKGDLQYQREVGVAPPLLFDPLDPELEKQTKEAQQFKANRSLRNVEPTVNLWLLNPDGVMIEESE